MTTPAPTPTPTRTAVRAPSGRLNGDDAPHTSSVAASPVGGPGRLVASIVSTSVVTVAIAALPGAVVWRWSRWTEAPGPSLADPLVAVGVLVGALAMLRTLRPGAELRRVPLVPIAIQDAARRFVEPSAYFAGPLRDWTTANPDVALDRVEAPTSPRSLSLAETEVDAEARTADHVHRCSGDNAGRSGPAAPVAATTPEADLGIDVVAHRTERGETFWSLAESRLGDGQRWTELRDLNIGREVLPGTTLTDRDVLRAGWTIHVPVDRTADGSRNGATR